MPSSTLTLTADAGSSSFFFTNLHYALVEGGSYAEVYDPTLGDGSRGVANYNTNATSVIPNDAKILGVEITVIASYTEGVYGRVDAGISQSGGSVEPSVQINNSFQSYKFGSSSNNLGADSLIKLQVLTVTLTAAYPGRSYLDFITATVFWEVPSLNVLFFGESF